jgi:hypothetical protein
LAWDGRNGSRPAGRRESGALRARQPPGTAGDRDSALIIQGDGNLVLYAPGNRAIWASGSQGGSPAKPDIVHVGREIQSMGYSVTGHSQFPPVGGHTPTSWHYKDRALDINWYPGNDEAPKLDDLHSWIQRRAPQRTELLWRVDGHYDHSISRSRNSVSPI